MPPSYFGGNHTGLSSAVATFLREIGCMLRPEDADVTLVVNDQQGTKGAGTKSRPNRGSEPSTERKEEIGDR